MTDNNLPKLWSTFINEDNTLRRRTPIPIYWINLWGIENYISIAKEGHQNHTIGQQGSLLADFKKIRYNVIRKDSKRMVIFIPTTAVFLLI